MSPLNAKLLRDLRRIRAQAAAIALVIAVGVLLQVMMSGLVASLTETRRAYYERYRLADVFVPLTRAPESVLAQVAALPGVARAHGRVAGAALVDLPGLALPVQASALSLPDRGAVPLNDIYMTEGRRPEAGDRDGAVLIDGFARARNLRPGDTLDVTMNGKRRALRITGLAQAPELIYAAAPGEFVPDDARYAVIWMRKSDLEGAFDLTGAVNEVLIALERGAEPRAVIAAADRLLGRYGGRGAYGRADHRSDRFLSEEIRSMRTMSGAVPPLFLGVAAFLLYIVISRIVQSEREEIGLLKAFGYRNGEVGAHYFKLVLLIAVAGAALGCLLGIWAGRWMVGVFTIYYKFPFLVFRLDPASLVIGFVVSTVAASAGGLFVLTRVFALTPAEAMRPPAPADFSGAARLPAAVARRLDQPTRMVLRRITRQPVRLLLLALGIAGGMALSVGMTTTNAAFQRAMDLTFSVMDRSDVTVSFTSALAPSAVFELARIPGVQQAEPLRDVSVVLRNGTYRYRTAITGLPQGARLARAVGADLNTVQPPRAGILLSTPLAQVLNAAPGTVLSVDVREGRQPVLLLPVVGVSESLLGAPAYMDLDTLTRALGEPGQISGARLAIDPARSDEIYRALKEMPVVAGVSVTSAARIAMEEVMNSGAGSARYVMWAIAFIITFGIVFNAARIAHAERARDLASLRVMGFGRGETGFVLLGELGAVVLIALPMGAVLGQLMAWALAHGFSTEIYQIPVIFSPASHGFAALFVLAAAAVSGVIVGRELDRADPVSALKTRE